MTKTKLLNALVKQVCAKEKGKKQLNAGQAREALKVLASLCANDRDYRELFFDYIELNRDKKGQK
jgi:hypothetical protein